jgi:hypothetical protein
MSRHFTDLALLGCLSVASAACSPQPTRPGSHSAGGKGDSGGSSSSGGNTSSGGKGGSGSGGGTSSGGRGGDTSNGGSAGGASQSGGTAGRGGNGGAAGNGGSSTGNGGSSTDSGGRGSGGSSAGGSSSGGSSGSAGGGAGSSGIGGGCNFDINAVTASAIATVGVVTWGTSLSNPTSAHIDFGLDTSYGMTAPVAKPTASGNKTLLLGMKQKKTYHYRVVASNGSGDCSSDDKTITTGSLATGLPTIKVANKGDATSLFGGFLLTAQFQGSSGGKAPAIIFDKDGDIVWAYSITISSSGSTDGLTGARMSYDGSHMWINSVNVGAGFMSGSSMGTALVHRVAMDGTDDQDLSSKFPGLNHQLTVLPDETVAYYGYSNNGCDDIKEYAPSGTTKTIVNSGTAQGGASACHVNNIQYASDDTLIFSDLDNQVVVKVNRKDGSTVWMLNGGKSPLPGVTWKGSEHGIYVMDPNQILVFNNNSTALFGGTGSAGGTGDGSKVLQLKIDPAAKTVSSVWSYKGPANLQTDIMGDIQRLPNGNTIIGYSTKGAVQEVDKNGTVLTDWTFPLGAQFGYIEKRATLYGPPPR